MGNLFHLSIMHTWTDSATFGAIDRYVNWFFFLHSPCNAWSLQFSSLSSQADGKVKQYTCKCIA